MSFQSKFRMILIALCLHQQSSFVLNQITRKLSPQYWDISTLNGLKGRPHILLVDEGRLGVLFGEYEGIDLVLVEDDTIDLLLVEDEGHKHLGDAVRVAVGRRSPVLQVYLLLEQVTNCALITTPLTFHGPLMLKLHHQLI